MNNYTAESVLHRMAELEVLLPNYEDRWNELKAQYQVLAEEDAVEHTLAVDGANGIPSPCPFHFYDTDGVHVVMVNQCNHPKRKEWRERPAAKA